MTKVRLECQHSSEEGLVDESFPVDLASELILKDGEKLNRSQKGTTQAEAFFKTHRWLDVAEVPNVPRERLI